ncbi:hypothetical protein GY45DRAFT_1242444 [Cubamyces sp. BRFM 1775]|nr:hypothetical protein GY45DRAFT_1242444 [Cubamyces sp. BRFM 1775]
MSEQYQNNLPQPDAKRRKLDGEAVAETSQSKGDKTRGGSADKAKANYLSGQLRLRLQYAKLKVEHGWQRQSLNEVENLYFRHTHLTRPYPVISPGGRRNGRTSSSNGTASSTSQPHTNGIRTHQSNGAMCNATTFASPSNASLRSSGTLGTSSSSISADTHMNPSIPSTPNLDGGRAAPAAPQAPHLGFSAATRYPISRSDSTATVILESAPSLYQPHTSKPESSHAPLTSSTSVPTPSAAAYEPSGATTASPSFREPFDPMQPTEHIDSQLAALRSMMATSSMPIPTQTTSLPSLPVNTTSSSGLTYDAFWSSHSSATASYRALLATQPVGQGRATLSLQAHISAPAVLAPPATATSQTNGHGANERAGH